VSCHITCFKVGAYNHVLYDGSSFNVTIGHRLVEQVMHSS